MTDEDDRIAHLEGRIRKLEDVSDIYRLMATYGPSVDSNALTSATAIWTEDGEYNLELGAWSGIEQLTELFESDVHQVLLDAGCSHQVSLPRVTIDGDRAVATCYQQLVRFDGERYEIPRQSANRWELLRTPDGWKVQRRFSRKIDGGASARELLAQDLDT